jgi:acyl-CoA carboxylase subunit beta
MTQPRDGEVITVARRAFAGAEAVVARWNFAVHGGTFGTHEAAVFERACAEAADTATPLVTVLRSGGTRLQEGMRALVGIPRATIALDAVALAKVPHVCVADHPTTGGIWVAIGAAADVRAAVAGATVGFSGPRVIAAMTGEELPPGANTAESAVAAGLVDDVVEAHAVDAWLTRVLATFVPDEPFAAATPAPYAPPVRTGWQQVLHSRSNRTGGAELIAALLPDPVWLRGRDASVRAALGRVLGRRVLLVAVAATRAGRATPGGYRLLSRVARLADRLAVPLVTLVDCAGADPLPASENDGLAEAIGESLSAVLRCGAPTVAIVHGEGGSGGALAAAVTDVVAVTTDGWFAALSPEGAAAALRRTPHETADMMRVAPGDLLADGFADAVIDPKPEVLGRWIAAQLDRLVAMDPGARMTTRRSRWGQPLRPNVR